MMSHPAAEACATLPYTREHPTRPRRRSPPRPGLLRSAGGSVMRILGMALALLVAAAAYPAEAIREATPETPRSAHQTARQQPVPRTRRRHPRPRFPRRNRPRRPQASRPFRRPRNPPAGCRTRPGHRTPPRRCPHPRPTPIEFDYRNTPLPEAVADLAKRTGFPVVLHDPTALAQRRVTARTNGKVDFWQAVELFCRKADLHEWDGVSPLPPRRTSRPNSTR